MWISELSFMNILLLILNIPPTFWKLTYGTIIKAFIILLFLVSLISSRANCSGSDWNRRCPTVGYEWFMIVEITTRYTFLCYFYTYTSFVCNFYFAHEQFHKVYGDTWGFMFCMDKSTAKFDDPFEDKYHLVWR
jgi:hypothetical protein